MSYYLDLCLITIICILLIIIVQRAEIVDYFSIKKSARRIKLRDKGAMESYIEEDTLLYSAHAHCRTRIRIGIDEYGNAHEYCWRCEMVLGDYDPGPKNKKSLPKESVENSSDVQVSNIFQFRRKY
jgi:hypothetical protein